MCFIYYQRADSVDINVVMVTPNNATGNFIASNHTVNLVAQLTLRASDSLGNQYVVCRWYFGDEWNATRVAVLLTPNVATTVRVGHVYHAPGRYEVRVDVVGLSDAWDSIDVTVQDPVGRLIVGHDDPTLIGNGPTFVEVRIDTGSDIRFHFRSANATKTWAVFNGSSDGVAMLAVAFASVGDYVVEVDAANEVSRVTTSVMVHAVDTSTLRIVGLTTSSGYLRPLCGLPIGHVVRLIAAVVHWNVSGLMFNWYPASGSSYFVGPTSGYGLRQININFSAPGVFHLGLRVFDVRRHQMIGVVYELCANETTISSADLLIPPPSINYDDTPTISVDWPTAPYVPLDHKLVFFPMVRAAPTSISGSVDASRLDYCNFAWSFDDTSDPTSGRTASRLFRLAGIYNVTADELFSFSLLSQTENSVSSAARSTRLTIVAERMIESVVVRFVSASSFDQIVGVNKSARFVAVITPSFPETDDIDGRPTFTWSFRRDGEDGMSDDVVVTKLSSIERSFSEPGRWTVKVTATNRVTTSRANKTALESVEVDLQVEIYSHVYRR